MSVLQSCLAQEKLFELTGIVPDTVATRAYSPVLASSSEEAQDQCAYNSSGSKCSEINGRIALV